MTLLEEQDLSRRIAALRPGQQLQLVEHGHVMLVFATTARAHHTDRPCYLVGCETCGVLVHGATTGPLQNVESHCRRLPVQARGFEWEGV